MKTLVFKVCLFIIFIVYSITTTAQSDSLQIDSLKKVLLTEKEDTNKVNTLIEIGSNYSDQDIKDESLLYYFKALTLAEETGSKPILFKSLYTIAHFYMSQSDNNLALEYGLKAQHIAEQQNNKENLFQIYDLIGGFIYFNQGKYDQVFEYGHKMVKLAEQSNDLEKIRYMQAWFGDTYRLAKNFDSSRIMYYKAWETAKKLGNKQKIADGIHGIGMAYVSEGNYKDGISYFIQSIKFGESEGVFIGNYAMNTAEAYLEIKKYDSALFYTKLALDKYKEIDIKNEQMKLYNRLSDIYSITGNYKEAYNNKIHFLSLRDSINSTTSQNKINVIQNDYKTEKQKEEIVFLEKQARLQNTLRNVMIGAFILLIIIAVLITNKYRENKKSEMVLSSKNGQLIQMLTELQSTQAQLIQSEKMASLGELTAGIAHEIQNPLNFVNNFSDVNKELLEELKEEADKGNLDEVKAIANDVIGNEEKINHHGKRADAIVKGMLQHSRQTKGVKELTDINALCDEYLRLSYHGLRAKDKSFNADFKTDFDENIGTLNIVPQDMGRVLLNLFNNAFYTVNERKKQSAISYQPSVFVQTKKGNDNLEIVVKDNGNGIPQNILDKIFQPFFTTKPTGQGTGLGLSLAYDIITKEHGGTIKAVSKEGEGTTFVIQLPTV